MSARGPERQRLDAALDAARPEQVISASLDWHVNADKLRRIALGLRTAAGQGRGLGGRTGDAMFLAMKGSADRLDEHAAQMTSGAGALGTAHGVFTRAAADRDDLDTNAQTAVKSPTPYVDKPGLTEEQNKLGKQAHDAQQAQAVAQRDDLREQRARKIADDLEVGYVPSIKVMEKIHGQVPSTPKSPTTTPPTPTTPSTRTPTGSGPGSTGPTRDPYLAPYPVDDLGGGDDSDDGGNGTDGGDDGGGTLDGPDPWQPTLPDDTDPSIDPHGTTQPIHLVDHLVPPDPRHPDAATTGGFVDTSSTAGTSDSGAGSVGVGAAVGAGALGAAGLAGLGALAAKGSIPGGLSALTSRGVPPLGGSVTVPTSGVIGRSTGVAAASETTSGTTGAGARTGGIGTSGSRGSAGGRGGRTGGLGGAGGRGKKDRRRGSDRDLFDDGQDWLDDEDVVPGVID